MRTPGVFSISSCFLAVASDPNFSFPYHNSSTCIRHCCCAFSVIGCVQSITATWRYVPTLLFRFLDAFFISASPSPINLFIENLSKCDHPWLIFYS